MIIGGVLAQARRQAGLTVTEVSHRTGIREAVITAIERADYAECGGESAARALVRSIARAVGTDPEPLIQAYDSERPPPGEDVTEHRLPAGSSERLSLAGLISPGAPYRRPRRRPPAWGLLLGIALVAGLGAAGYLLANPGSGKAPSAGAGQAPHHVGQASRTAHASPTATAAAPEARLLTPAAATAFGFGGRQGDNSGLARLAVDGNPSTAWQTSWYATARFGNLYPGTGLLLDMGHRVTITAVRIRLRRTPGADLALRVGSAPRLASLRRVAHADSAGGVVELRPARAVHGRYALIWFTRLPPDPAGTFRENVYGVQVKGRT